MSEEKKKKGKKVERMTNYKLDELVADAKNILDDIDGIEKERQKLNAQMAKCMADLEAFGLNRHAVKAVRQMSKLDEDQRAGFDHTTEIIRRALKMEAQADLFDEEGNPNIDLGED